jgi:hypothetical protein
MSFIFIRTFPQKRQSMVGIFSNAQNIRRLSVKMTCSVRLLRPANGSGCPNSDLRRKNYYPKKPQKNQFSHLFLAEMGPGGGQIAAIGPRAGRPIDRYRRQ